MKTTNAKELNEQYKDCPTQMTEIEIEGRKYVVISHFTGQKDLDDVVFKNAYKQAMDEVLHA
jgi:predicted transcriptional regulator YdeE